MVGIDGTAVGAEQRVGDVVAVGHDVDIPVVGGRNFRDVEFLDVARQRGLRHTDAVLGKSIYQFLLAAHLSILDDVKNQLLPFVLFSCIFYPH